MFIHKVMLWAQRLVMFLNNLSRNVIFFMKIRHLLVVIVFFVLGCSEPNNPLSPETPTSSSLVYSWKTNLVSNQGWQKGNWDWSYTCNDSLLGSAKLDLTPMMGSHSGWEITWLFQPALPDSGDRATLLLNPDNDDFWHNLRWCGADSIGPLPLPRQEVDSEMYSDLLELLQELTTPFFNQVVTHWPQYPIPVRLVPANNGPVDLAACLTEAAEIWNEGETQPWFVMDSTAGWGVRLVHFPDREMHPPLAAQVTRLDNMGRPLRIHLLAGNNYNSVSARPYVVRGFVHELGHALFLWGHSQDRIHCLWGLAPPMVSEPSQDERKAARWWHGLPDGLDLSQYGIEAE